MKRKRLAICATIILMVVVVVVLGHKKDKIAHLFQRNVPEMPIQEYNSMDVENLALLCKVWGFMKYYHPAVRSGKHD